MTEPTRNELATPTLMRAARGVYATAIRAQLEAAGIDDLPSNGAFILAGIGASDGARQDLPSGLGVTRQAISQTIDILATRGFIERSPDADDRRRITLELTERGRAALDGVVRGVEAVDEQLRERLSAEHIEAMRSGLVALAEIKSVSLESGAGLPRPARQFRKFEPIFPVRDLAAALEHYAALGFRTFAYDGPEEYGFANREGLAIHLAADHDLDPEHNDTSAYLYVRDADALYEEWTRPGILGRTTEVTPRAYKLREGAHTDPDGNRIRFGSPIQEAP